MLNRKNRFLLTLETISEHFPASEVCFEQKNRSTFFQECVKFVNDRVLPDERVSSELERLIFETQEAFASDLKGFEAIASARKHKNLAANDVKQ